MRTHRIQRDHCKPTEGELCEECQAILESALDRLLELESRVVESRTKLISNASNGPLQRETVREHIDVLKTSLLAMDEYRALLLP